MQRPRAARRLGLVALALLVPVAAGCTGGSGGSGGGGTIAARRGVLDGTPRIPTAEGVITASTLQDVTLDDGSGAPKVLPLSRQLESFSSLDGAPLPVLQVAGLYAQLKVDAAGLVVWIGALGPPNPTTKQIIVNGTVKAVEGGRVVLEGGLVLSRGGGFADQLSSHAGDKVRLVVDTPSHRVVAGGINPVKG